MNPFCVGPCCPVRQMASRPRRHTAGCRRGCLPLRLHSQDGRADFTYYPQVVCAGERRRRRASGAARIGPTGKKRDGPRQNLPLACCISAARSCPGVAAGANSPANPSPASPRSRDVLTGRDVLRRDVLRGRESLICGDGGDFRGRPRGRKLNYYVSRTNPPGSAANPARSPAAGNAMRASPCRRQRRRTCDPRLRGPRARPGISRSAPVA